MTYRYSKHRLVDRLYNLPQEETWLGPRIDAHAQLSGAVILYWREALAVFWEYLKRGKPVKAWRYAWFYLFNGVD